MPDLLLYARFKWRRLNRDISSLTTGGRWAERLSYPAQHNLSCFWLDGFFAISSDNIVLTYLTLYVLALGGTTAQIGAMSALSSLSAALLLFPGAMLVERTGRRKAICVSAGGGVGRLMLLLLALLPFVAPGPAAVYLAMGLSVTRDAFGNLALPAWMALTADIVPLEWRGRYFASRNFAMSIGGMATTFLVGALITRVGGLWGFQLALALAFGLGIVSTYNFSRIREPKAVPAPPPPGGQSLRSLMAELRAPPGFLALCAATAIWSFSLNIAGPFFTPYMAERLKASAFEIGIFSVVSAVAGLPALRLFGNLADRWGPRRVQLLTGLLIPFVPLTWMLSRQPWHVVPINTISGFLWAGYGLASFNFLLSSTPADRRARYSAIYQIVVTVSLALGAALGGLVATQWGFYAVFFLSGVGRMVGALYFARFVPERRAAGLPQAPSPDHSC
jgi:MFS family permease